MKCVKEIDAVFWMAKEGHVERTWIAGSKEIGEAFGLE